MDQLKHFFTPHRFEATFLHNGFNHASVLDVVFFHQIDQRKRELSLADVVGDWLPKLGFGRYKIKDVVDQLERHPY